MCGSAIKHEYRRLDPYIAWQVVTVHVDTLDDAVRVLLTDVSEDQVQP